MTDNFDLRKFISENRVGPYIRTEGNDNDLPPAPSDEETAANQVTETSLEAMERMDGLAPIGSVKRLIAAAGKIIRDLKEEGFDEEDIYEYIIERIRLLDDQNY